MFDNQELLNILFEYYPINFTNIKFFREGGSFSYIVFSVNKKYFLRIVRPPFDKNVIQSIEINLYLNINNFLVPTIIRTKNGEAYLIINNQNEKNYFILYDYIEGQEPNIDEDIEEIGCITAKLHLLMQDYPGQLSEMGKYYFIDRYIDILNKKLYPKNKLQLFENYGNLLWDKIKILPKGYYHGDYFRGNLHKTHSGKIYVLDFDTSAKGFPMYDIMMICNSTNYFNFDYDGYDKSRKNLECFLKGYNKYKSLTQLEIDTFFDLIAVYHYQLQANILEIHGLDCVNESFLDKQLDWLMRWKEQCEKNH